MYVNLMFEGNGCEGGCINKVVGMGAWEHGCGSGIDGGGSVVVWECGCGCGLRR